MCVIHLCFTITILIYDICQLPDLHSFPTRRSSDLTALRENCKSIVQFNKYTKQPEEITFEENTYWPLAMPAFKMDYECRHRSEEHTSELQSRGQLVCRLLLV